MTTENENELKAPPKNDGVKPQQPEVMHYAVPAPVLKAAIDLIDEEISGKKGRRIVNALEQSQLMQAPSG